MTITWNDVERVDNSGLFQDREMTYHEGKMEEWEFKVILLKAAIESKKWELQQLEKRLEILKKIPPLDGDLDQLENIPHIYIQYSPDFNDGHDMLPNV